MLLPAREAVATRSRPFRGALVLTFSALGPQLHLTIARSRGAFGHDTSFARALVGGFAPRDPRAASII
ncbi:MAG: hypothetical protein ACREPM_25245 [Gemmatimonadaceae bacterium]